MRRLIAGLLRLYPRSFRETWGAEMLAAFEVDLARTRGPAGRLAVLLRALADTMRNAPQAHLGILAQDLRYARRTLLRAPAFTVTAVLVAAFGVGANTAAFSLADFVLVRPLPFPEPDRLVRVWASVPGYSRMELSPPDFRDWREGTSSLESWGAFSVGAVNLQGVDGPIRASDARVSEGFFSTLGVTPFLGRTFGAARAWDADARTVVLSHALWQTALGGDPRVLGRSLDLDGTPHVVVGVMPPGFRFPSRETRLWTPLRLGEDDYLDRTNNYLHVVGRLAEGVTLAEAGTDLGRAAARVARDHPSTHARTRANVHLLQDDVSQGTRLVLNALLGAALCILVLACANLTNLLLARGAARRQEMAVRTALGAGRERLARQLATESLLLALIGGATGVALAAGSLPLLARLVPTSLPIAETPAVDLRLLALALGFTAVTGLGFGLVPALAAGGRRTLSALRSGGRGATDGRHALRTALVSVQVAASLVLLVSVGLLTRAVWRVQAVDPGFRTEGVLTLRTALPRPRYDPTEARHQFYSRVLDEVRALPGVEGAAYTTGLPLVMRGGIWAVTRAGDPQEGARESSNTASLRFVTPGYFGALDIPLIQGRDVSDDDTFDREPVAVVSAAFAARHWPGEEPLGRRFTMAFAERTVVGVVGDVRVRGLERESEPQVYLPHRQVPDGGLAFYAPKDLVVRTDLPPGALLPALRRIVGAVDPGQPLTDVRTIAEVVAGETAERRTQLGALVVLATTALLLAAIGLQGLLAYVVSLRTREIGVRLALGARRGGIAASVVGRGIAMTALGAVPGIFLSWGAGRALAAMLLGVEPGDPGVLLVAVAVVFATALAGSALPALRALRIDPVQAMRE